jgi:hypothetical protein
MDGAELGCMVGWQEGCVDGWHEGDEEGIVESCADCLDWGCRVGKRVGVVEG